MFHASNANHLALIMKADPVVADPQPKLWRLNALKALDVSLAGFEISSEGLENTKGGTLIDGAKLSLRLGDPDDVLAHSY